MHLDSPSPTPLGPRIVIAVVVTILLLAVVAVLSRESKWFDPPLPPSRVAPSATTARPPTHVGSSTCRHCHAAEFAAWQGSHHDRAYSRPSEGAIVGEFDGQTVEVGDTITTFRTQEGRPVVDVAHEGETRSYPVHALFGTEPLQQLLIETEPGRVQAFPIAATTPEAEGGARWLLVHDPAALDPSDPFHWTGLFHNWNHMCAECHSTAVTKGFDRKTGTFATTMTEPDVACEACHGPGSAHVAWAARGAPDRREEDPLDVATHALSVTLRRERTSPWVRAPGEATAKRAANAAGELAPRALATAELSACGRCHSRRTPLVDGVTPGLSIHDTHALELLTEDLYFTDGQILDEVFVLGSILQSPMHAAGVTCSDCHDSHSGDLHVEGNGLCLGCHAPEVFETPSHHNHAADSPGAACVECHMPPRTYMKVDPRRDHSFRVPRPDLSVALGVPDPCLACHEERDSAWSRTQVEEWFPEGRSGSPHFAIDLDAIRAGSADAIARRDRLITDATLPAIVRATALAEGVPVPPASLPGILAALDDPSPLVRRAALDACLRVPPEHWLVRAIELTEDPLRSVRLEATRVALLAGGAGGSVDGGGKVDPRLERGIEEVRAVAAIHGDRPESAMQLGLLAHARGNRAAAKAHYQHALAIEPTFGSAAVNLADLHREEGSDQEGAQLLEATIARSPKDAGLHYALALTRVRLRDLDGAERALRRALEIDPADPRTTMTLAVLLAETGRTREARARLDLAIEQHPRHAELREVRRSLGD